MRSWTLQGSNDRLHWSDLSEHKGDVSLSSPGQWAAFHGTNNKTSCVMCDVCCDMRLAQSLCVACVGSGLHGAVYLLQADDDRSIGIARECQPAGPLKHRVLWLLQGVAVGTTQTYTHHTRSRGEKGERNTSLLLFRFIINQPTNHHQ